MPVLASSFRDPKGRVLRVDDKIYRAVLPPGLADFHAVKESGVLEPLIEQGKVIGATEVGPALADVPLPDGTIVLEHPLIVFQSYPYEWSFPALKAAALLHLDIQIEALARNTVLSDASAYNIMFRGAKPVFIDYLSFRPYREREHWQGHRQFCEQFLNPLLLSSKLGVPFNAYYRGALEGISAADLAPLLRIRDRFSLRTLSHVFLMARLSDQTSEAARKATSKGLSKNRYHAILLQLRRWIAALDSGTTDRTVWGDYAKAAPYSQNEFAKKRAFVEKFAAAVQPGLLLDLGCNTGDFSLFSLQNGARAAIGFDTDQGALEQAFKRADEEGLNFQPLYQDAANPSPAQGWRRSERDSIDSRSTVFDALLGLAFVHHLAIGRNIPLDQAVAWIIGLAPRGILEFVDKQDPTIRKMLTLRDDVFEDYSRDTFVRAIKSHARIVTSEVISDSGRELFWYDRGG